MQVTLYQWKNTPIDFLSVFPVGDSRGVSAVGTFLQDVLTGQHLFMCLLAVSIPVSDFYSESNHHVIRQAVWKVNLCFFYRYKSP